jgi:hypothetical protein
VVPVRHRDKVMPAPFPALPECRRVPNVGSSRLRGNVLGITTVTDAQLPGH